MARNHQWREGREALGDLRVDQRFQLRAGGVTAAHVRTLQWAMEAGGDLEPLRVAKIGKALYIIDGFHRLEAAQRLGRANLPVRVTRMSLDEALEYATTANTRHGKNLTRADKAKHWATYVAQGRHLDESGVPKPSRTIRAELGSIWSHETIRKKLGELGLELDPDAEYGGHYKPWGGEEDEGDLGDLGEPGDELEAERNLAAVGHLEELQGLLDSLEEGHRRHFLGKLRELVGRLERGEPAAVREPERAREPLDI